MSRGCLGGAFCRSRSGRGSSVQSMRRFSGSLAAMPHSALHQRRELRSESTMKVRAVARETLIDGNDGGSRERCECRWGTNRGFQWTVCCILFWDSGLRRRGRRENSERAVEEGKGGLKDPALRGGMVRMVLTDSVFARAVKAAATKVHRVSERHGWRVVGPFGHPWEMRRET